MIANFCCTIFVEIVWLLVFNNLASFFLKNSRGKLPVCSPSGCGLDHHLVFSAGIHSYLPY